MTTVVELNAPDSSRARWQAAETCFPHDREKALQIFEELAAEGYVEAYVEIGNIHELGVRGQGTQDFDAARSWYMRAVEESNSAWGYIGLARLALNGWADAGTAADAFEFLEIASEMNNPVALTMLGVMHHMGRDVPKNLAKAAELYQAAAAHGYVLPMSYHANLLWQSGRYFQAAVLKLKAIRTAYKLAIKDRRDARLWNFLT